MSDARLRELERRWKASGALSDQVAFLTASVRSGELAPARLEVAAVCSQPAAKRLIGSALKRPRALFKWLRALVDCFGGEDRDPRWLERVFPDEPELWTAPDDSSPAAPLSQQLAVRGLAGLARDIVDGDDETPPEVEDALRAAEQWAACPCDTHRRIALLPVDRHHKPYQVAVLATYAVKDPRRAPDYLIEGAFLAAEKKGNAGVRRTLEAELGEWAIGGDDPLRARLPTREQAALGGAGLPYDPRRRYTVGESVRHPRFGLGTVVSAGGKRVEIEFASGRKRLAQG